MDKTIVEITSDCDSDFYYSDDDTVENVLQGFEDYAIMRGHFEESEEEPDLISFDDPDPISFDEPDLISFDEPVISPVDILAEFDPLLQKEEEEEEEDFSIIDAVFSDDEIETQEDDPPENNFILTVEKKPENDTIKESINITVESNYQKIDPGEIFDIYKYIVVVDPQSNRKEEFIESVVRKYFEGFIFYESGVVYCSVEKNFNSDVFSFTHNFTHDNGDSINYFVKVIKPDPKSAFKSDDPFFLNAKIKKTMRENGMIEIDRKFYTREGHIKIDGFNAELWPGYSTSVMKLRGGLYANIETSYKMIINDNVLPMINQNINGKLVRFLGQKMKIIEVMWDMSPQSNFSEEETYAEYYKKVYGLIIKHTDQPLLKCENKNGQHVIIPEFAFQTGFPSGLKINRHDITKKLMPPPHKYREIIGDKFIEIPARVLNPEKIYFSETDYIEAKDGDWSSHSCIVKPINFIKWTIIIENKYSGNVFKICKMIVDSCRRMGIKVKEPNVILLDGSEITHYVKAIDSITDNQFILLIVPKVNKTRYEEIKKKCFCEYGLICQIMQMQTTENENAIESVDKIVMQIDVKLGCELWNVKMPLENTMYVGIDVYHDPTKRKTSVAGLICTMNDEATKFHSQVIFQGMGQEICNGLKEPFEKALLNRDTLPEKIIIYRDGVSDSQFMVIINDELGQIKKAISMFEGYQPEICLVVVKKRINTRFIYKDENGYRNPDIGVIVTESITTENFFDFFMTTQNITIGTSVPIHYQVLHNSTSLSPDEIYRTTFKLCHLYPNWRGTTKNPNVCHLAHQVAQMCGHHMGAPHSEKLDNYLFYILKKLKQVIG